jgi:hypothetical protein
LSVINVYLLSFYFQEPAARFIDHLLCFRCMDLLLLPWSWSWSRW